MISVEEAKREMMRHLPDLDVERVVLHAAIGRYTVGPITSPVDHPLFDMSAVDGYAFQWGVKGPWKLVGEVPAGGELKEALRPSECARIFTGAMLPEGADTVVMQEFLVRFGERIGHNDAKLKAGANVRRKGEQVRTGNTVLDSGTRIDPEAVGLLASIGIDEIDVRRSPTVTILLTGNEFLEAGKWELGKIHSSNGPMLIAALAQFGIRANVLHARDDEQALDHAISVALRSDIIISTGGVSVGDHDLVREAVQRNGGEVRFHGVAQKPGKPMLFATFDSKVFFGLPGNPRAVMVLFWEYVLPFLRATQGASDPWLPCDRLPIGQELKVKGDRAEFRAAHIQGGVVSLLRDEGSHMLTSLRQANAIAYIPADARVFNESALIEVHYLPR